MDAFDAKQWDNYNFDADSRKKPWQNYDFDSSVTAVGTDRSIFTVGKSSVFAGFGKVSDSAVFDKDDSGGFKADFGHTFGRKKDIWARDESDDDDGGFIERETDNGGFAVRPQVGCSTIRPPQFTVKLPIEESKNLSGSVIKKPSSAELQMGFRSLKPVSKVDRDTSRVESVDIHQGLVLNAKPIALSPLPKPPRRDLKNTVKKIDTLDRIEVDENFYMQKSDGFLTTNAPISDHGTRSPFKRLKQKDFEKEIPLPKMTLHCRDSEKYHDIVSNVTDDESNSSKSFENNFDFRFTDADLNKPKTDDNRRNYNEGSEGMPESNKSFLYPGKENTLRSQTGKMENFNMNQDLRENISSPQELQGSSTKTFGMGKFMRKKHKDNSDTSTDVRNDGASGFNEYKSPIPSVVEPDVISNSSTDLRNTKSPDSTSRVFKSMINNFSRFSKRRPKMDENDDKSAVKRMKKDEKGIQNDSHQSSKSSNVIGEITKKFPIKLKRKEKRMAPMAPLGNIKRGSARFEIKTYSEEHNHPTNKSDVCTTAKTKINWFQKQLKQFESVSEQGSLRSSKNSFKVSKNKVSGLTKEFDRVANTETLPSIEHKSFSLPRSLKSQHCLYESETQTNTCGRNVQVYPGTVSDRIQRFTLISAADGSQQKGPISDLRPTQKVTEKVQVKPEEPKKKEIVHQPYHMRIEIEDYI